MSYLKSYTMAHRPNREKSTVAAINQSAAVVADAKATSQAKKVMAAATVRERVESSRGRTGGMWHHSVVVGGGVLWLCCTFLERLLGSSRLSASLFAAAVLLFFGDRPPGIATQTNCHAVGLCTINGHARRVGGERHRPSRITHMWRAPEAGDSRGRGEACGKAETAIGVALRAAGIWHQLVGCVWARREARRGPGGRHAPSDSGQGQPPGT